MFKQIDNLDEADELWRAGILYFKYTKGTEDYGWELDDGENDDEYSQFRPSRFHPGDFIYAILLED